MKSCLLFDTWMANHHGSSITVYASEIELGFVLTE